MNHIIYGIKNIFIGISLIWSSIFNHNFGVATLTAGFNYPTSTPSYNDGDIINAGDFNSLFTFLGVRNSTDTTSVSYQASNPLISNSTGSLSVLGNTTGAIPTNKGGIATTTSPTNSQVLIGNTNGAYSLAAIPDCNNASTSKLIFSSTTLTFTCGVDQMASTVLPSSSSTIATTTLSSNQTTTTLHWQLPTPRVSSLYIFTFNQTMTNGAVTSSITIASTTLSTCAGSTNVLANRITLQMINSTSVQGIVTSDLAGFPCNNSSTLTIPMGNNPILEVSSTDTVGGLYTINGTYTFIP